MQRGAFSKYA